MRLSLLAHALSTTVSADKSLDPSAARSSSQSRQPPMNDTGRIASRRRARAVSATPDFKVAFHDVWVNRSPQRLVSKPESECPNPQCTATRRRSMHSNRNSSNFPIRTPRPERSTSNNASIMAPRLTTFQSRSLPFVAFTDVVSTAIAQSLTPKAFAQPHPNG